MANYLQQYQDLMNSYTSSAGGQNFQDQLEKALGERTGYNKDLIEQQNQLQSQMYNMPQQARAEYLNSNITNPLAQEALIAQQRQNVQSQLGSTVDLLNARKQNYSNILSQAMGRENQAQEQVRLSAENAWRLYQDQLARQEAARQAGANASALQLQRDYLNSLMNPQSQSGGDTYDVVDEGEGNTAQARILTGVGGLLQGASTKATGLGGRAISNLGYLGNRATQLALKSTPFGQTQTAQKYYDMLNQNVFNPVQGFGANLESNARNALSQAEMPWWMRAGLGGV